MRISLPLSALLLASLTASSARANVVANGPQNFNPTPDGLDFLTVQSSETLRPGIINLGLFFNYALNSLPYVESSGQNSDSGFTNGLLGMDLNVAMGLLPGWEVGLSAPWIVAQHVSASDTAHGQFAANGMTELRPNTKVRVYGNGDSGVALVGTLGINTTANNPYRGLSPAPDFALEAAGTTRIKRFNLGLNLGYRWMNPGAPIPGSFIKPMVNQWIASAAGSYLIEGTQLKVISELFSSFPASHQDSDSNRLASSLELLLGVKHDLTGNLAYQAGIGAGLLDGVASPDVRFYAGLNYAFGPLIGSLVPRTELRLEKADAPPSTQKYITRNITFDFDSVTMTGDYRATLEEFVRHLTDLGTYTKVVVTGYTDSMGKAAYNQKLSERRAHAIVDYLVQEFHLDAKKLSAVGKGADDPVADNGNFQGRLFNRRVEFTITQ